MIENEFDRRLRERLEENGLVNLLERIKRVCKSQLETYQAYQKDIDEWLREQYGEEAR